MRRCAAISLKTERMNTAGCSKEHPVFRLANYELFVNSFDFTGKVTRFPSPLLSRGTFSSSQVNDRPDEICFPAKIAMTVSSRERSKGNETPLRARGRNGIRGERHDH